MKNETKSELRAEIKRLKKSPAIGMLLSDICFNGAQRKDVPADLRKSMTAIQELWDAAVRS